MLLFDDDMLLRLVHLKQDHTPKQRRVSRRFVETTRERTSDVRRVSAVAAAFVCARSMMDNKSIGKELLTKENLRKARIMKSILSSIGREHSLQWLSYTPRASEKKAQLLLSAIVHHLDLLQRKNYELMQFLIRFALSC